MADLTPEQEQQKAGAIAGDKAALIDQTIAASTKVSLALADATRVLHSASARGYIKGGPHEITDEDLLSKQFTAEEYHKIIELFGELRKFSQGSDITADQWGLHNAKVAN